MSTITALSFSFVSLYASSAAKPAAPAERPAAAAPAETHACGSKQRAGGRENRLAQAMMSALRELGIGAVATDATTPAATAATTATTAAAPAASGTDAAAPASTEPAAAAVVQFAHALFQALRQGGGANASSGDDDRRVQGDRAHGHHHHEQHHHHLYRRGEQRERYGDLSQRLEALAQTFGTSTPAATTGPVQAGASAASGAVPAAPTVTSARQHPLLEAFTKLFNALKAPEAAGAATAATSTDADLSGKLRLFLHTLAEALRPDALDGAPAAPVGALVNVTA